MFTDAQERPYTSFAHVLAAVLLQYFVLYVLVPLKEAANELGKPPARMLDRINKIVLQAPSNAVIALPPTTMEIVDFNSDIKDHIRDVSEGLQEQQEGQAVEHISLLDDEDPHATFMSFTRKYQPNSEIRTHTPPKLPIKIVQVGFQSNLIRATRQDAYS